jgi:sugar phosphate isomerase/epimerase
MEPLMKIKPKLAAFPKAFMDELCVHRTMTVFEWIALASTLDIDGVELYSGFLESDPAFLAGVRDAASARNLEIPMLCCSPDFTAPDLKSEIEKEIGWVRMTAALGGKYCRVLSGQRRPNLSISQGVDRVVRAIQEVLPIAQELGVTLVMENHYKDNYWTHPEFAQKSEVFVQIIERIEHPNFGVNFDPSNAFLAEEDPLEVLQKIKGRVLTMHASDRFLLPNNQLAHGVIGEGLNDYDAIFSQVCPAWVSIEDGMNGMDDLRKSVRFLREKLTQHFGAA